MELCWIRPMQRVTVPQRTTDESFKTTRNCAIPPGERQDNIVRGANALRLFGSDDNIFVQNAGLRINKVPLKVQGRLLHPPRIRYGDSVAVARDGKWRISSGHFFKPAQCESWAIYAIIPRNEKGRFDEQLIWNFGRMFCTQASYRGLLLRRPMEIAVNLFHKHIFVEKKITQ
ncbi:hypothetical protein DICVIV_00186 [Dictyocaulus viviparus]|uniref:Argonaute linker 2 domain-containing protein n=1 Tax=Dictyocaulus viviparus TaxID=29172 RepID=A0A0D8YC41_DICVI|nr:hypothetical protein DICVIV_00186 [Dictyocaulus viviparus]